MIPASMSLAGSQEAVSAPSVGPSRLLIVGCAVLIVLIGLGTIWSVFNMRHRALADNERELKNVALILAEQTERTFQAVKLVQVSIDEHIRSLGINLPEEFNARMSTFDIHQMLRDKISGLPFVETMGLANSAGGLVNFARSWPPPPLDLSDRRHFQAVASQPGLDWIVSNPVRNRIDSAWTIYVWHKVRSPGGDALGYLFSAISLDHFEGFFASIALNPGSSISLFQEDATLLVRYPRVESFIGRNLGNRPNLRRLLGQTGTVTVRSVSALDGEDRIFAARRLGSQPISVLVTTTVWAALADWRRDAATIAAVGILGSVAIAGMFALIIRDLNRRRDQTEQRIAAQKHQLDVALDHMSQGLCMFDGGGRLVISNRRYSEIYRLSEDPPAPGMSMRDLVEIKQRIGIFAADTLEYINAIIRAASRGLATDHIIQTSDERAIRVVQMPIVTGGWVVTHQDVTDLRRAEEERDRQRRFLDRVIENVPSCIVVKDYAQRRFVLANRSAEELYRIPAATALGKSVYDLFDKATADAIHARDEQSLRAGGELFLHEDAVTLPDGRTHYLTSKRTCIRDSEGKPEYLLNVIEDVTERRLVQQQLQQAQRMEVVGQLTGGLAHDFNNLLHIIIGNLDLLALDVQGNAEAVEKVEAVLKASLRGAELTAQLLAFSRRQSLAPRPLQLNDLLQGLIKLLKRTLGEGIEVELKLDVGLPTITADEAQLEAAVVNIAINARDAMANGGKLFIETRAVTLDREYCAKHAVVNPGAFVLIEITDTGTGMPPEVLSHIFEPFYTTKDPGRGTGLGLSMVFGFVRQSGGHITADSKVGVGTTFRLYLPCSGAVFDQVTLVPTAPDNASAGMPGETILVVEDNPAIRSLAGAQLRELRYRVIEAEDAAAALDTLAQSGVDLLFTDIVMPGSMNGKQLATAAQRRYSELKVLFTSGFPGSGNSAEGVQLDSSDVLLKKPYRKAELAKAVRDALDQTAGSPQSSELSFL